MALVVAWVSSFLPAALVIATLARIEGRGAGWMGAYLPCGVIFTAFWSLPGAVLGVCAGSYFKPPFLFLKGFTLALLPVATLCIGSLLLKVRYHGLESEALAPVALLQGIPGGIGAIVMGYTRPPSRKEPNGTA